MCGDEWTDWPDTHRFKTECPKCRSLLEIEFGWGGVEVQTVLKSNINESEFHINNKPKEWFIDNDNNLINKYRQNLPQEYFRKMYQCEWVGEETNVVEFIKNSHTGDLDKLYRAQSLANDYFRMLIKEIKENSMSKFKLGEVVLHKKTGNKYKILSEVLIEEGQVPSYLYFPVNNDGSGGDQFWVRPKEEMEDGRFIQC